MFDWRGFLALATSLAEASEDEAALRSAASRAYYASFHHAKSYIERTDPSIHFSKHGRVHEELPEWLKERGRTRLEQAAARKLEDLKRLRTWADYRTTARVRLADDVKQAVHNAQWILNQLSVPQTTG